MRKLRGAYCGPVSRQDCAVAAGWDYFESSALPRSVRSRWGGPVRSWDWRSISARLGLITLHAVGVGKVMREVAAGECNFVIGGKWMCSSSKEV